MGTAELGARGEDIAAAWLERHGFTIVDRNWRCARGEVDIVASLQKLAALRDAGALSDAEFDAAKARLLS